MSKLVWTTETGQDARLVDGNVTTMLVAELAADFSEDAARVASGGYVSFGEN